MKKDNPRVTLMIGSGGIKCAAAAGMWRVLNATLKGIYGDLCFEDLGVPLKIVATGLLTGEKKILCG